MPLKFRMQLIADERYESACAFDVDNDGRLDIVSGAYWYEGPDFVQKHPIGEVKAFGRFAAGKQQAAVGLGDFAIRNAHGQMEHATGIRMNVLAVRGQRIQQPAPSPRSVGLIEQPAGAKQFAAQASNQLRGSGIAFC